MASVVSSSPSRSSTSSPTGSRPSTPSSQSSPSEFLANDLSSPLAYGGWTLFSKIQQPVSPSALFDTEKIPSSLDNLSGLDIYVHGSEDRGMLLEDIMQEDAYENGPSATNVYHVQPQQLLVSGFEPHLPHHNPAFPPSLTSLTSSPPSLTVRLPSDESQPSNEISEKISNNASKRSASSVSTSESLGITTHSSNTGSSDGASLKSLLVTVPNATCPNAPVITPPQNNISNLPILIHNVPHVGAKSRVETQIKMTLDLALPSQPAYTSYERVGSWKWIKLPKGTSTRRRPRKEAKPDARPEDALSLSVAVTCASDPSMSVLACTNCLTREAKRTERKKAARVRPVRRDSSDSEDGEDGNGGGKDGVRGNIVVFNCPDLNDFSEGRVVLPVRVTCYCRHHREKLGFRIAFTMTDWQGRVIGRGSTPPIMITDDHKSVVKAAPASAAAVPPLASSAKEEQDESSTARRKKRARDDGMDDVRVKRRAKESSPSLMSVSNSVTGSPLLHQALASGAAHNGESWCPPVSMKGRSSQSPSAFTTAPSSPQMMTLPSPSASSAGVYLHYPVTSQVTQPEQNQTPTQTQQMPTPASTTLDTDAFIQNPENIDGFAATLAAAAASAESHRSSSTKPFASSSLEMTMSTLFNTAYPSPPSSLVSLPPQIHRLIPSSGPTHGGIEITVLGSNFLPTHQCVFGDTVATSTQMWSENTLVCLLPPSAAPGPVVVSFEGIPLNVGGGGGSGEGGNLPLFNYLDNSDRALMELALQVVGLKMTGRIEEAKNVAMRIVGNSSPTGGDDVLSTGALSPGHSLTTSASTVARSVHHLHSSVTEHSALLAHSSSRDFQSVIIEFLGLLDIQVPAASAVSAREAISHSSPSGQTMLHLSALLGFHRLLKHLIQRGIDVDARDANGYTALHFAALSGRLACARFLVEGGADVEIVEARGRTAREIARWRDQIDVELLLQDAEQRAMVAQAAALADQGAEGGESELEDAEAHTEEDFADEEYVDSEDASWDGNEELTSPTTTIKPFRRDTGDVEGLDLSDVPSLNDNRPLHLFSADMKQSFDVPPTTSYPDEKKHPLPSEKSPQSLFHRTLSHLHPPPLPTLPNMPGLPMPQWAVLPNQLQFPHLDLGLHMPEIPMVFPVHIPTPSWPAAFQWQGSGGEKLAERNQQQQQQQQGQQNSWGGYDFASPWFGLHPNRWPTFSTHAPAAAEKSNEHLPKYTPKPDHPTVGAPPTPDDPSSPSSTTVTEGESAGTASGTSTPRPSNAIRGKLARRLGYGAPRTTERGSRTHNKQTEKSKLDTMLVLFWIPILLIVIAYGLYQGVPALMASVEDLAKTLRFYACLCLIPLVQPKDDFLAQYFKFQSST
ncbi:uncharacterized protein EI90DRAFT_3122989 [Cantharellus anzutake]|uniref:uncharacterized protein n=1 Tax=Cantharellus anzutake TaxID=1750568 RepID=UPI001907A93D|nr:uncharacterized protein EI90DRAFT_3122989 [Cantharellus anzutake]KAF8331875.1 hypothetical protein EI90DRAFT_3122989 [Cantharellus anzutake]